MTGDDQSEDDQIRSAEVDKVLDRNWNELLQELRVAQTGTQILTGFLLTLPFSTGFKDSPAANATSTWSCSSVRSSPPA